MRRSIRRRARLIGGLLLTGVLIGAPAAALSASPLPGAEASLDSSSSSASPARGSGARHPAIRGTERLAARPAGIPSPSAPAAVVEAVTSPPRHINARLRLDLAARPLPIPRSFLGISTEYWALPMWARHLTLLDRVLSLVHGPGPLTLRIGGTSSDWALWESRHHDPPDWAFELTPSWLREVRRIVDHTRARIILDLNNVTSTPTVAARWARRFAADLPGGRILGFEVGNEPDGWGPWMFPKAILESRFARRLPRTISASDYARSFSPFARALSAAAPHVPLLGPALAEPDVFPGFVTALLAAPHPGLTQITVHRYPFSACDPAPSPYWPTVARILSPAATSGMVRSLRQVIRDARRAGLPLRLTELNSVTCGGVSGVSNTFATALWAPDALFALARAGVVGAAIHVRARAINAPFVLNRRGLYARPLLYGMILFRRMLGADPRLVPVHLWTVSRLHLTAWAVRSGQTLRVLLIDKGRRTAGVSLSLPGRGGATVQRLSAPSIAATGGVTLAGQTLGRDGRWTGTRRLETIRRAARSTYRLQLAAGSAAMVTVALPRG